jgi:hypothetical protein
MLHAGQGFSRKCHLGHRKQGYLTFPGPKWTWEANEL